MLPNKNATKVHDSLTIWNLRWTTFFFFFYDRLLSCSQNRMLKTQHLKWKHPRFCVIRWIYAICATCNLGRVTWASHLWRTKTISLKSSLDIVQGYKLRCNVFPNRIVSSLSMNHPHTSSAPQRWLKSTLCLLLCLNHISQNVRFSHTQF